MCPIYTNNQVTTCLEEPIGNQLASGWTNAGRDRSAVEKLYAARQRESARFRPHPVVRVSIGYVLSDGDNDVAVAISDVMSCIRIRRKKVADVGRRVGDCGGIVARAQEL